MASVSRLPSQTGAEIAFLVAKSMYAPPCLTALDFSSTLGFLAALDALDEPADEHSCTDRVVNTSVLAHTQTRQQRKQLQRRGANLAGAFPAIMWADLASAALL